ncbi:Protein of unknown function [Marinospirillum celere]|uniref:DUF3530 domain-containing protein n=1 Tax=Marinospirillum celere TaxID=1122252 RepID=A0A1I1H151_9GAMM|nr:DUF3530 family protein [Marinospirillum celere]SFC14910.1 Protein of unknown function [Marinospirillum celere]
MKYFLLILLMLMLALQPLQATGLPPGFADEEDEEEEDQRERAEVDYQRLLLKAMLEQVEEEEILELDLDDERQFLLLQQEALSASPKGNLFILPGDGLHPNWPLGVAPLRKAMADQGWHTLALSLPLYQPLGPPDRTLPPGPLLSRLSSTATPAHQENDEEEAGAFPGAFDDDQDEEEEIQEPPDPAERLAEQRALVEERLQLALNHQGTEGRQVLVLQGEAVFWLLPWLEAGNWPENAALVLLNVKVPEGARAADLNQALRALGSRPLLDVYDPRSAEQRRHAEGRKAAYRRAGNQRAVQLPMEANSGQRQRSSDAWLTQRVEGWLRSLD